MGRGQELLDAAREGDRRTVEKILGQITKRSGPFTSLRRGAGVNVQDDNGYTPLHHACLHGRKEIVRLLLQADASPCVVDKKGATPLHLAAFKGDSDVVAMLLAHNNPPVNIDQLTSDNETALLIAAHFGYVDVVAQLMAKGADVTKENNNGESALDLAAQYGRLETVQHLLRVRPDIVEQYKVSYSKPPYKQWIFTSTPLHRASKHGRKEVVATLIQAGVDPNVRTADGTALHEAVRFGKHPVVKVLLEKGADIDARDSQGKTVYDLLADYSEDAMRKVRRALKDYENRRNQQRSAYESDDELLPPFPVPGPDHSPTGYHHSSIMSNEINGSGTTLSAQNNALVTNNNASDAEYMNVQVLKPPPDLNPPSNVYGETEIYANEAELLQNLYVNVDLSRKQSHTPEPPTSIFLNELQEAVKKGPRTLPKPKSKLAHKLSNPFEKQDLKKVPSNNKISASDEKHDTFRKKSSDSGKQCLSENQSVINGGNLPDDEKVKLSSNCNNIVSKNKPKENAVLKTDIKAKCDDDNLSHKPHENAYLCMNITDSQSKYTTVKDDEYMQMNGKDEQYICMNNADDHHMNEIDDQYLPMKCKSEEPFRRRLVSDVLPKIHRPDYFNKLGNMSDIYVSMDLNSERRSIPNSIRPTIYSVHFRGDVGCMFEDKDYWYIYHLNPTAAQKFGVYPFIKEKQKAEPVTCFCHKMYSESKAKPTAEVNASQFFSCEDLYVDVNNDNKVIVQNETGQEYVYQDLNDIPSEEETELPKKTTSFVWKKKLSQFKTLMFDWQ